MTILITVIYPQTEPSIILKGSSLSLDTTTFELLSENRFCTEIILSASFKNKGIHRGYVNNVEIKPQFINVKTPKSDNHIEYHLKYLHLRNCFLV